MVCDTRSVVQTVSPSRWQVPQLDREDRWIGGVAAAIAREVGVQTVVIRVAFVVLAAVGGGGLVLYAAAWAALAIANPGRLAPYHPQPKAATPSHRLAAVAMITIGLVVALLPFTSSVFATVIWPVGFVLSGVLIAWTRSEEGGTPALVRVVAGIVVAIGGFLAFTATQVDFSEAIVALVFGVAIVSGIVLVAAPSVVRMGRDLDHERQERIRADERSRINAHLHDSVLQTLTLIQQHVDDPVRTRQLARRQERELRTWLHGPSDSPTGLRLGPALEYVASQVEERFDVTIDVVTVGDTSDLAAVDLGALAGAASEAMVNAARHAVVARVDVYAEHRGGLVQVFIRDTGIGFEPTTVGPDRQGVRNSIVARMERAGGGAIVTSEVGIGTEVELRLPVDEDAPGPDR